MARETKVGLLAGLAFIVCFAVILTNKGQRVPFRPSQQVADATRRSNEAARPAARRSSRRPTPRYTQRQDAPARSPQRFRSERPSGVVDGDAVLEDWGRHAPVSAGAVPQRRDSRAADPPHDVRPAARTRRGTADVPAMRPGTHGTAALQRAPVDRSVPVDHYRSTSPAAGGPAAPAPTSLSSHHVSSSTPQPAATDQRRMRPRREPNPPVRRRRARLAKYTVAPGDTLSRIAANHYGRASRANIKAIVNANSSTIENPDVLRAGAEILIPVLDAQPASSSAESRVGGGGSARRDKLSATAGSFRWYQIRPGDRYMSIAREQLGDASRWEEIFTMNFDKFPDPGKIRVGVRIKIPVARSASAGGRP